MLFCKKRNSFKIEKAVAQVNKKMKIVRIVDYRNQHHFNNSIVLNQLLRKIHTKIKKEINNKSKK